MSTKKIALVTGANKGIGFEAARQLGRQGFTVLLGARDATRGAEAASRLHDEKLDAHFVQFDVTDEASVQTAAQTLAAQFGHLDVLVNNAGVNLDWGAKPSQLDLNILRQTLDTNLDGVIRATQALLPLLKQSADARVINVSSTWGSISALAAGGAAAPAYHLSKAVLNMWTVLLAGELRGQGVTVNSICPGWVQTDMGSAAAPRTVEQGAAIITKVATQAERLTGGFFDDDGTVAW